MVDFFGFLLILSVFYLACKDLLLFLIQATDTLSGELLKLGLELCNLRFKGFLFHGRANFKESEEIQERDINV